MFERFLAVFSKLSLRAQIYFALAGILVPVFVLTLFIQIQLTKPLLQEEVRQAGLSICHSLESEISAFKLLTKIPELERLLVETSWNQPSVMRLDVIVKDNRDYKILATTVSESGPVELNLDRVSNSINTILKKDDDRNYWEILYPITEKRRVVGYIRTQISLQLVERVVTTIIKIVSLGTLLSLALLILLLSYFLRRMIENERKLHQAESHNIQLTEQVHEMQRQLYLNEKLAVIGELTASFAHEIGTPLNSVSGHLQLLDDDILSKSGKERLNIIHSQVQRIERIVKEFLTFTHTPTPKKEQVDVKAIIEKMIQLVLPRIQITKTEIQFKCNQLTKPIYMVSSDLEQILLNLTNNALDALQTSTQNKQLFFQVQSLGNNGSQYLQLSITDTGGGIAPENLKKVLKPFFTTKPAGHGTGLGLTISERLIRKYGGKLKIDSILGKGTTIKVSIPYVREENISC